MALEQELTDALVQGYYDAGKKAGYWGRRFLQAVKRNGGLPTVKRMLLPRNEQQRKGLDALLEAGHPELTVEAIILQDRFKPLFSATELQTAAERLGAYSKKLNLIKMKGPSPFPDELPPGQQYVEGAKKYVRVNAYERDAKARKACISHYGAVCVVCSFSFEKTYGQLGKGFIHVHHLKPLALTDGEYQIDPIADLRPVCPNCHAMLHQENPPMPVEELKAALHAG
ncbi:HNH endonuclease [Ramlibacter sp.]|uniref:HNH endonuclease n=1 Tax=Ramlibacter sp. TaxID=1917967 RepID=UPI002D593B5C|nr:HNH endonuclease [Ramlibacter sp.]HYD76369.1 HNH endonuclease [Ramlibacter sp.]